MNRITIYILISFLTSYAIRALPITCIRKPITNIYVQSFLYYVPYVTLSLMTFPAMTQATSSPLAGWIAFVVGIVLAYKNKGLPIVAFGSCITVLLLELFL